MKKSHNIPNRPLFTLDISYYFQEDYSFFQKFSKIYALFGTSLHPVFYFFLFHFTPYYESLLLRLMVSLIFLTLFLIPQNKPMNIFFRWHYELVLVLVFPVFFQILLYENHFNQYWSLSMMSAAIIYGMSTHPVKALFLYPASVVCSVLALTFLKPQGFRRHSTDPPSRSVPKDEYRPEPACERRSHRSVPAAAQIRNGPRAPPSV